MHPVTYYRLSQSPKLKAVELAERLGVSRQALWRVEKGRGKPGRDLANKIKAETGISLDVLLGDNANALHA